MWNDLKNTFRKTRIVILPLFSILVLAILLGFIRKAHDTRDCAAIKVIIQDKDEYKFVSEKEVIDMITNHGTSQILGMPVGEISLSALEARLLQNSFVKEAQASLSMDNALNIVISQRVPRIRVFNQRNENYYLDTDGKIMPTSDNYTAKVPVATAAYIKEDDDSIVGNLNKKLCTLAMRIGEDRYIEALSGQVIIDENQEFSLVPRLGKFEIFLGDTSDLRDKFVRLKSFYKTTLPQVGWNKYSRISLKYKNQIIANHSNED